jgi:anti-sigma28 factor (negative regulator of flagellin synthesis)
VADEKKTPADRVNERREAKLAEIRQQVEDGTLTIRQMTDEERELNPPRPKPVRGKRW